MPTEQHLTEMNNKKDKAKKRKRQEDEEDLEKTREGFLRKNIVAVSFFQNCAIHQYS